MRYEKITLVGVGLLGGSLGLAIKERGLAKRVEGYVRRAASVEECHHWGVVDRATMDLASAIAQADLVILCTPIAQMRPLVEQMLPHLQPGALVTDVGSVKASVVNELEPIFRQRDVVYIGSHPMAGSEKTGPAAARADLFDKAITIITPTPSSLTADVEKVEAFWQAVGSRTLRLTPEAHDELVSRSSHLPHIVAAGLANFVLHPDHPKEQAMLCANGFRDATRIASGSPEMWRDIASANRQNLAHVLGAFIEDLKAFQAALTAGDLPAIMNYLEQARERREQWQQQTRSAE